MKRIFVLLFIAVFAFLVIYFIKKPEVLENIWLWLVGLAGSIIAAGKRLLDYFKGEGDQKEEKTTNS